MSADTKAPDAPDYRDTVFLPQTDFPMRAGLPAREPEWLARWARIGIYDALRKASDSGRSAAWPGPQYTNGPRLVTRVPNRVRRPAACKILRFAAPSRHT